MDGSICERLHQIFLRSRTPHPFKLWSPFFRPDMKSVAKFPPRLLKPWAGGVAASRWRRRRPPPPSPIQCLPLGSHSLPSELIRGIFRGSAATKYSATISFDPHPQVPLFPIGTNGNQPTPILQEAAFFFFSHRDLTRPPEIVKTALAPHKPDTGGIGAGARPNPHAPIRAGGSTPLIVREGGRGSTFNPEFHSVLYPLLSSSRILWE